MKPDIVKGHEIWTEYEGSHGHVNENIGFYTLTIMYCERKKVEVKLMEVSKQKIKSYWNVRSSTFDDSPGHIIGNKRERDVWKNLLKNKLGDEVEKILDIGAGTGFLSLLLAEMGYKVTGIDLSENMLSKAKRKAQGKGLKIDFQIEDAEALSFKDGIFDAIVNRAVLWTIPDPKKAVKEWMRVLKPGGKVCFFLHEPQDDGLFHYFKKQLRNFLILLTEKRNPWSSLYQGKSEVELPFRGGVEPAVVTDLLEKVGFDNVSAESTERIGELQMKRMPLRYKIGYNYSQICYTALKPAGGNNNE